ncbi:14165_t:CDS:2 [Ambispora leptoticha]|uniref:14165_t:CDS:1 n=1 Tax=Ambispora leptoticha TaxID=144679 RepID=A0A9N8W3R7_9GLOM|nr:14165_t:CDS:2 [Ambispora leptoticha]
MSMSTFLIYSVSILILGLYLLARYNEVDDYGLSSSSSSAVVSSRQLYGNFLHITDLHPDPHYQINATFKSRCHKKLRRFGVNNNEIDNYHEIEEGTYANKPKHMKHGISGVWGGPASICDTPMSLINATFDWLKQEWADKIDFVLWTGDNSRHDNDDRIPRKNPEILKMNRVIASKFQETFSRPDKNSPKMIPIIPVIGNNDIYPSNIITPGPNNILQKLSEIWSPFIPKSEMSTFRKGGYYATEVIKDKLIVVSLNTLYFFRMNTAVQGCSDRSQPGTEQIKWLNKLLLKAKKQHKKVYLIGHVAPTKKRYTRTCWNKYGKLAQKYHDVILGHFFGHSNMDHFYFIRSTKKENDLNDDLDDENDLDSEDEPEYETFDEDEPEYETFDEDEEEIMPPFDYADDDDNDGIIYTNLLKTEKFGSKLLRHYRQVPSLNNMAVSQHSVIHVNPSVIPTFYPAVRVFQYHTNKDAENIERRKGRKNKQKYPKNNNYLIPYNYIQYFMNLTHANLDLYSTNRPTFQIEYTTRDDYNMTDLSTHSWLKLAKRIVRDAREDGPLFKKFKDHMVVSTREMVDDRIKKGWIKNINNDS